MIQSVHLSYVFVVKEVSLRSLATKLQAAVAVELLAGQHVFWAPSTHACELGLPAISA